MLPCERRSSTRPSYRCAPKAPHGQTTSPLRSSKPFRMPYPRKTLSKHSLNAPGQLRDDGRVPTDPPPTAETCLQTIRLLAGQFTVYTDGSASAGTKDGGEGVIVTRGDSADPTILHWSHLRGAAFTSSFIGRSCCQATRIGMDHRQPPRAITHNLHRQSIATQGNGTSVASDPLSKITPQRSTGPDNPPVDTRAQRNPWQRARSQRSQNNHFNHQRPF